MRSLRGTWFLMFFVWWLQSTDTIASTSEITLSQDSAQLVHTTTQVDNQTKRIKLTMRQNGLLIIISQQSGEDISHKLTLNTKFIGEINGLNITQGPEIAAIEVNAEDTVLIEVTVTSTTDAKLQVSTATTLVTPSQPDFEQLKSSYLSLTQMGIAFAKSGDAPLDEYNQLLEQALAHSERGLKDLQDKETSAFYHLMHALILYDLGNLARSREQFEHLLDQQTALPSSLTMLAKYFYTQYFGSALAKGAVLSLLTQVVDLAERHQDSSIIQNASVDICTLNAQNDRNQQALTCFEAILSNKLLANAPYKLAIMSSNLANVYQKTGQHRLAVYHRQDALTHLEAVKYWPGYRTAYQLQKALYLRDQATHLLSLGLNNNALSNHLASLHIFKQLNRQRFINFTLLDLARLYLEYDQPHLAKRFANAVYQSSIKDQQADVDGLHFSSSLELMSIYQHLKETKRAKKYYKIALQAAQLNNHARRQSLLALRSLALNYSETEQRRELELLRDNLDPNQQQDIIDRVNIALSEQYLSADDHLMALSTLNTLQDAELSFKQKINVLYLKARLLHNKQQDKAALEYIAEAERFIDQHFMNLDNVGLKRSFYHQHQPIYFLKTAILASLYKQTNDQNYLWQASTTNQITLSQRRKNNAELAKKNRRFSLAQQVNKHNKSVNNSIPLEFIEQLLALENIDNNGYSAQILSPQLKLNDDNTPANTTTLHYVLASPSSYLFVINSKRITMKLLPDKAAISSDINKLLEAIKKSQPKGFVIAKSLSEQLLPRSIFETDSTIVTNLRVIASGALWQLPFNLLPLAQSTHWQDKLLIDNFTVNKSTTLHSKRDQKSPERFLVISDPVYSFDDRRAVNFSNGANHNALYPLPRLKSTQLEKQAIEQYFPQKEILSLAGFTATKSQVIDALKQDYQVIHIASHGFANKGNHHDAGLYFSAVNANGKQSENLLSLYEIEQLTSNAQLVILSACQTNVGKAYFKRASDSIALSFLKSGVTSVIASQWQVPSRSTAKLMQGFYYELSLAQSSYPQALRSAMLTLRKKYSNPSRWAGFTLITNS